jgi:glycerol transport system permease protein
MALNKPYNNRAWLGVLPVLLIVSFSAVIPLMTVVNYSVQDILDFNSRFYVGLDWYRETLQDPRFIEAFGRQVLFSLSVLAIEIPLGILVARGLPKSGAWTSFLLILLAVPLLIPWNVVGTIWQIYARSDIGLLGVGLNELGLAFNYTSNPTHAWLTLIAMDVWHWTSLVALLAFAGLTSVPPAYYQAAELDGASKWQVFRYVEMPRLGGVLVIAVLLRLMDSFMIYTEPFVLTGGGPGNATTFLSQYLATMAVGQFDLGPAAAFSVIYFLFILLFCWIFYNSVMVDDAVDDAVEDAVEYVADDNEVQHHD